MPALFKRLSIVALAASLGACTMTPVDLLIPAGVALANHVSSENGTGSISVSAMLRKVRGEPAGVPETGGPVSVEAMLAKARGETARVEAAPNAPAQTASAGPISVAEMLAKARASEPAAPADSNSLDSLDALRAQVLARSPDTSADQVCR